MTDYRNLPIAVLRREVKALTDEIDQLRNALTATENKIKECETKRKAYTVAIDTLQLNDYFRRELETDC